MIDRKALAAAARELDDIATTDEGFAQWALNNDVDIDALFYVSKQQALRGGMVIDGEDPTNLPADRMSVVNLTPETQGLLPILTGLVLNGIAIGMSVQNKRQHGMGKKMR